MAGGAERTRLDKLTKSLAERSIAQATVRPSGPMSAIARISLVDPDAAADRLAEALGGRARALGFVEAVAVALRCRL
jgi:hypothetical protein